MEELADLRRLCPLRGLKILDIGTGSGAIAAAMAGDGAHVTGVEIDAPKVAAARARYGDKISIVEGLGEALPFPDASYDLACFFFSLHHVPIDAQAAALSEAKRVLRPGGKLHVVEPLPQGSLFELVRLVDDETEVRRAARAQLQKLIDEDPTAHLVAQAEFLIEVRYTEVTDFISRLVGVDPDRAARLPAVQTEIETGFADLPRDVEGQVTLREPCVFYHFEMAPR